MTGLAPACTALLDSRGALGALRRTLPRSDGGPVVVACRSVRSLGVNLLARLPEAIVVGTRALASDEFTQVRLAFSGVPVVVFAALRPDLGRDLLTWERMGVAGVAVEGVDDAVVGELVARCSLSAGRHRALRAAPWMLRLTEPLQREVWDLLVRLGGRPVLVSDVARQVARSREYLSRQFGAGGAPNLKRVIDLTRVATAAQLLASPAYSAPRVAELLGFASSSHLSGMSRRIAGVPASGLAGLGPGGVLTRFVRGNMRSRKSLGLRA